MMSLVVAEESPTGPAGRIGLRYFSLYRLALATLFLILVWSRGLPAPLGTDHPALFGGRIAYLCAGFADRQRGNLDFLGPGPTEENRKTAR